MGKAASTGFRASYCDVPFIPAVMDINRLCPNVLEGLPTGMLEGLPTGMLTLPEL